MIKLKFTFFFLIALITAPYLKSQVIEIEPLFEYPTAPEELESLSDKSNYLVQHFWDSFDFKNKQAVDQNALNDAFRVYVTPLMWAEADKSLASLNKLLNNISKNPTLLQQFARAAEENLYGPRAEYWVDDIYVEVLNSVLKNKKIPEKKREKYARQLHILNNSKVGNTAPSFSFKSATGENNNYFPMSTPTLLIFGNPLDPDWTLRRLRLETNVNLSEALDKGKINILYIVTGPLDGWQKETTNYPSKWVVGEADNITDEVDVRSLQSAYVIGSEGKILAKNLPPEEGVKMILGLVQ